MEDIIIMLPCFDSRVEAVVSCNPLTLLPTVRLPLTQALSDGKHVLGRQQLQQDIQHLIVPPGKKSPNLLHNRVVNAPPRSNTKAGPPTPPTIPVTAKAPLDLAIFNKARVGIFLSIFLASRVTVLGRLLAGRHLETNLKPTNSTPSPTRRKNIATLPDTTHLLSKNRSPLIPQYPKIRKHRTTWRKGANPCNHPNKTKKHTTTVSALGMASMLRGEHNKAPKSMDHEHKHEVVKSHPGKG